MEKVVIGWTYPTGPNQNNSEVKNKRSKALIGLNGALGRGLLEDEGVSPS